MSLGLYALGSAVVGTALAVWGLGQRLKEYR